MDILFLLGAGASVEAHLPTSYELTPKLIEQADKDYYQDISKLLKYVTASLFQHGAKHGRNPYDGLNVEELLEAITLLDKRDEILIAPLVHRWDPYVDQIGVREAKYPGRSLQDSFESLALDLSMVIRGESRAKYSLRRTIGNLADEIHRLTGTGGTRDPSITSRSIEYLRKALRKILWIHPDEAHRVSYLTPLIRFCKDRGATIATLNYDNTIELASSSAGLEIDTGLDKWSFSGAFNKPKHAVELLKLHGSLDWELKLVDGSENAPFPHKKIERVDPDEPAYIGPAIIFGAGNKLSHEGPYRELLRAFEARLSETNLLVTIGYSYGDPHINSMIFRWMNSNPSSRAICIDRTGLTQTNHGLSGSGHSSIWKRVELWPTGTRAGIVKILNDFSQLKIGE